MTTVQRYRRGGGAGRLVASPSRCVRWLSGGHAQRVRFALAIAGESDLIVLDEPATAMDVEPGRRSGRP